jgi:hypothetical protein
VAGFPRQILPATPRMAAEYAAHYGWENASLHGESSRVLNVNGNVVGNPVQLGYPSNYMPIPTTDAEAVALGWPSVAAAVDGDIWLCDEAAGNLVGKVRNYQLAPQNAPLQNREFVGCEYGGTFWGKKAIEAVADNQNWADGNGAECAIGNGVDFSISMLLRCAIDTNLCRLVCKWDPAFALGWDIYSPLAGNLVFEILDATGYSPIDLGVSGRLIQDNAVHLLTVSVDRNGNINTYLDDNATVSVAAARPGDLGNTGGFRLLGLLGGVNGYHGQAAWVWHCVGVAATRTGHDNLWRHGILHRPFLHARTNPLTVPISASRVATYAGGNVGQAAVGYDASLVTAPLGNPLGTGYVAEDGATFEPIGSDNLYGNSGVVGTIASVDGPSGMRDGVRNTQSIGAWPGAYANCPMAPGVAIVGASDVPWRLDISYRRATVGTTARAGFVFVGSLAGPEWFTNIVVDNATPVDWTRAGGTVTPINADHTNVYLLYGAAANLDDCNFGEPALIKNRTTAPLAWRRVGTAAAAVTTTPSVQVTNTLNRYYSPLRGQVDLIIGGCQLQNGAVFLSYGAAGAAGALVADYSGGQLRVRIWDVTPALTCTMLCGPLTAARTRISICWDVLAPLRGIGGAYAAVLVNDVVVATWLATWVPPTAAVTPLAIGCDTAGANSARAFIELA